MNFKAGFSAIPACCESGCRRDTASRKMKAGAIPFFISTTDRTCSIRPRHTSESTGKRERPPARLIGEGKIPPLIIVGIDNAQKDRPKEYLPYRSMHPPVLRPQGKRYPDFLLDEVMPFVEQRYRIAGGPENTGLGGSSLGAIISLFTVMDRPGSLRPFVAGEPVVVHLQPAAFEIQRVHSGNGLPESSWRWEPESLEMLTAIDRWSKMFANWNTICAAPDWEMTGCW